MIRPLVSRLVNPSADDLRHYGGFVLAGGLAFLVDVSILHALSDLWDISPLVARPFSILCAMVVSWWINRTVTFRVGKKPSLVEFLQFAAVVWFAQAVNYAVFAVLILQWPEMMPALAVAAACLVSMCISYMGYRYGVFRTTGGAKP